MPLTADRARLITRGHIDKFHQRDLDEAAHAGLAVATLQDFRRAGIDPVGEFEFEGNLLVDGGINALLTLAMAGDGVTAYSSGNARLCVGDGNGSVPTVAATDTALTATTNRWNQAADAGFPSVSDQVLTIQATVPSNQGNFAWNEFGIDAGGASGNGAAVQLLDHRGVAMGTKTNVLAWAFTVTLGLS